MGAWLAVLSAVLGTVAVAFWAFLLSGSINVIDTVRCAMIISGVLSTVSVIVVPIAVDVRTCVLPGLVLAGYQVMLAQAFKSFPVATQAIVNTNVIFLIAMVAFRDMKMPSLELGFACMGLLATSATVALVSSPAKHAGHICGPE